MTRYLIDTDVLIDALRGNISAQNFIDEYNEISIISVLTVSELYAGVRNQKEEKILAELLMQFPKIALTEKIAQEGGMYRNLYGKSHGTGLTDALIAATAKTENAVLTTLNKKHYPMLNKIKIPYIKKHH